MELDAHFWVAIIHILLVVPLFLYVGFVRANIPNWLYMALFSIGVIILIYHGIKFLIRLKNRSSYSWVNALHILTVAPLLIYIGYHKKDTPRFAYELMLMLAFAAGGYHVFSIVRMLEAHPEPNK
jgi:succinate dehydrogenase hydrophobic anchor subunit